MISTIYNQFRKYAAIWLIWIALPVEGQFYFKPGFENQNAGFVKTLRQFSSNAALSGAGWGLIIKNPESKQTAVKFNERLNLIPASNLKVITALNGFKKLGPDFQYKTSIWVSGKIEDGKLKGNLLIEGSGDPTIYSPDREKFSDNFFQKLVILLKKNGIKKIAGTVEEKKYFRPYAGLKNDWSWSDLGNYYGAGIYPLNINENQYQLHLQAPVIGKEAKLKRKDSIADVEVNDLSVKTDAAGTPDLAYIYWIPGQQKINLKGTLPLSPDLQKVKGALMNPTETFFKILKDELLKSEIELGNQPFENEPIEKIGTIPSPTLDKIMKEVNLNSNNLMTESIGFALSDSESKIEDSGWTHLAGFANAINCPPGFYFADASGLSLTNRISPEGICNALIWAKDQSFFPVFYESLPTSGLTGTMKGFCKSDKARGKIHAKSGTLSRVLCYSGYVDAKGGQLAFSIMINSYNGNFFAMKKQLEHLLESMTDIK